MTGLSWILLGAIVAIAIVAWRIKSRGTHTSSDYYAVVVPRFPIGYRHADLPAATAEAWLTRLRDLHDRLWPALRDIYTPGATALKLKLPENALPDKAYLNIGKFLSSDGVTWKWAEGVVGDNVSLGVPVNLPDYVEATWWFAEEVHSLLRGWLGIYGQPGVLLAEAERAHQVIREMTGKT